MKKKEIISRSDIVWGISMVLNNWYYIVSIPFLVWAAVYLYAYKQQDISAASCQIMLKDESSFQSQFQEQFKKVSATFSYEYTAGQMRVIKSSDLIEKVLQELELDVRYFIVGRLKVVELYHHVPFKVTFDKRATDVFYREFGLEVIDDQSFQLTYESPMGKQQKIYQFGQLITQNGLYLQVDLKPGMYYSSLKELDYRFEIYPRKSIINKYKQSIEVENLDYTSIIEVQLRDEIPERAIDFLNVLSELYLQTTIQNQKEINENTLVYIDELLAEISGVVNDIEGELDSFKLEKNIINIDREEVTLFERLSELEIRKRSLEFELKALDDVADYVLASEGVQILMPPSVFMESIDGQIKTQLDQLFELKKEYESRLMGSNRSNPGTMQLFERIEKIKSEILSYKKNQEIALIREKESINREINAVESKVKFLPLKEREMLNIEKKIKVNEGLYDYLLSRRAEVLIAKAALVPQTKLIEVPRSKGVVYPDRASMSLRGLLVGLALAVLVVFIREFFFRKIRTRTELESLTDLSVIGSIPNEKLPSEIFKIKSGRERGPIIQSLRSVRAGLQYFPKAGKCHKILVTSLMPGEGKTFVSANLTSVLGLADKKVLVVDFDMHKPRLHKLFELKKEVGLSSFLVGKYELDEVIQATEIENCHVITAGPVPPNASELVLLDRLKTLIEYAETHYDYLILDTPPTAIISDSIILMSKVDTNIFVCSSLVSGRTSVDHIEKIVNENNVKGAALILNRERRTKLDYYYGKYGYGGYGYGYQYSYGDHSNE